MMRHADTTCATGRQQSVRETLIYFVWRTCFTFFETVKDGRVHSCFKKRSRLAKRNTCAFPGGFVISTSLGRRAPFKGFRRTVVTYFLWTRSKAAMLPGMKELDPHTIRPCLVCGGTNVFLESMLPPGRRQEVWRVVCSCGQTSQQWSVSQGAAIRAWNRNLASANEMDASPAPVANPRPPLKP